MRKLAIIFLLTSNIGFCQSDSLNPILEFVYSHHHKKIGRGICYEFVAEAHKAKFSNENFAKIFNDSDSLGPREVCAAEALPGDVICMNFVTFKNGDYVDAHIGIVTDVLGDSIIFASQNSGGKTNAKLKTINYCGSKVEVLKNSKVIYQPLDLKDVVSGKVLIYRF